MEQTARALVAPGKGVLAADESTPDDGQAAGRRGSGVDRAPSTRVPGDPVHHRGLSEYISGVILFDETARQRDQDGTPFPELLRRRGIVPGIKVDGGTRPLAGSPARSPPRDWTG